MILCCSAVLCIGRCLAVPLASTIKLLEKRENVSFVSWKKTKLFGQLNKVCSSFSSVSTIFPPFGRSLAFLLFPGMSSPLSSYMLTPFYGHVQPHSGRFLFSRSAEVLHSLTSVFWITLEAPQAPWQLPLPICWLNCRERLSESCSRIACGSWLPLLSCSHSHQPPAQDLRPCNCSTLTGCCPPQERNPSCCSCRVLPSCHELCAPTPNWKDLILRTSDAIPPSFNNQMSSTALRNLAFVSMANLLPRKQPGHPHPHCDPSPKSWESQMSNPKARGLNIYFWNMWMKRTLRLSGLNRKDAMIDGMSTIGWDGERSRKDTTYMPFLKLWLVFIPKGTIQNIILKTVLQK